MKCYQTSKSTYVTVEPVANDWVHTRLMHCVGNQPHPIYKATYACPAEKLTEALVRAKKFDHGLWGADDDY